MAAEYYVNLAKTIIVKVDNKCEPTNELEVIKIIEDYKDYLIRPYGGTHSWAPSVVSDYDAKDGNKRILVMDTSKLKNNKMEIVQIGDDKCLRMGPGETQGSMAEFAVKLGQCFPVTGALQTSIRVGGFLASGCHGTGNYTPLSDFVVALRIIVNNSNITGVDGPSPVIFSQYPFTDESLLRNGPNTKSSKVISSFADLKWQPPPPFDQNKYDLIDFARVHFGSLGIVTEIFIKTLENFFVEGTDEIVPLESIIPKPKVKSSNLQKVFNEYDYLEFFYHPFNKLSCINGQLLPGDMWLKKAKILDASIPAPPLKKIDPLDFTKEPLSKRLDKFIEAHEAEIEQSLIKNQGCCKSSIPVVLELIGKLSYDFGLDPFCGGICLCCNNCFARTFCCFPKCRGRLKTKITNIVPINTFTLYQQTAPKSLVDPEIEIPLNIIDDPEMIRFRTAWWNVIDKVKEYASKEEYPLNVMFHCRFNKPSKSILSSCYSPLSEDPNSVDYKNRWFATIEFISIAHAGADYATYLQRFIDEVVNMWLHVNDTKSGSPPEAEMTPRPHFAKSWFHVVEAKKVTGKLFKENILAFDQFRNYVDPSGMFNGGLVKEFVNIVNGTSKDMITINPMNDLESSTIDDKNKEENEEEGLI